MKPKSKKGLTFKCLKCSYALEAHVIENGRRRCPTEEEAKQWWGR